MSLKILGWKSKSKLYQSFLSKSIKGFRIKRIVSPTYSFQIRTFSTEFSTRSHIKNIDFNMVKIGTHNGTFHCDEALAVYLLRSLPEYQEASLVRTRDSALLAECDVVVDVGGVYDPSSHRYDHHQREFQDTFSAAYTTRLSSAGLVYKHFGKRIISQLLNLNVEDEKIDILYNKVYDAFIHALDAIDNGVPRFEGDPVPKYHDGTNLPSRVGHLLPWWNQSGVDLDSRFLKAVALTGAEFKDRVEYLGGAWLPARSLVQEALDERFKYHPSGRIVVFKSYAPWKDHIFTLEQEMNLGPKELLFVIYPDELGNAFRIQCIPTIASSFTSRLPLKEDWRGIRDDELSTLSSISGCIFVHASGNKTRDGAISMAVATLESAGLDSSETISNGTKKPRVD